MTLPRTLSRAGMAGRHPVWIHNSLLRMYDLLHSADRRMSSYHFMLVLHANWAVTGGAHALELEEDARDAAAAAARNQQQQQQQQQPPAAAAVGNGQPGGSSDPPKKELDRVGLYNDDHLRKAFGKASAVYMVRPGYGGG